MKRRCTTDRWVGTLVILTGATVAWGCGGGGGGPTSADTVDAADVPGDDAPAPPDVPDVPAPPDLPPPDVPEVPDTAKDADVPFVCQSDEDCQDHPVGQCQKPKCEKATGECGFEWDTTCALDMLFLSEGFEDGLPEGWTVDDTQPTDLVTWTVDDHRKAFGDHSLYLGNPKCHTYYNGELGDNCKPVEGGIPASLVRVSVTTPMIAIPPTQGTKVVTFYLWLDSEPLIPALPEQPDQFRVLAVAGENTTMLFTSVDIAKTTNGAFAFVAANLNQFTGQEVQLRFTFDTLDGNNNLFEGVYLDEVRVFSMAAPQTCQEGDSCGDDGNVCTDDACSVFANAAPNGYCAHPTISTCVKPECTEATVAQDCPDAGECEQATCVDGHCVYETLPDCCKTETLFSATFDDGSLDGFQVYSYQGQAKVKWQVSGARHTSGGYSLYYGDTVAKTYDTGDQFNFGEATSPALDLPPGGWVFLTFDLFLSTEFDDTLPEEYYNPLGIDFFEVLVVEDLGNPSQEKRTTVWSSHNVLGTTNGQFVPVGVDLSDFAGQTVWLRFKFDTSDEVNNEYEGVYVDNVHIEWSTAGEGCPPRRNCMTAHDCGVDGVCRTGDCVDSVCDVVQVGVPPECCATQQDCDDGDPCTADGCLQHACHNEFVEGPGCCAPETVKTFDFDAIPLEGFQVVDDGTDVKWQTTTAEVHSPPNALYFGNGTNYDNGGVAKGSALSPAVTLPQVPPEGKIHLSFFLYLDVDKNLLFDRFTVEVVDGDQSTPVFSKDNVPELAYATWFEATAIDLTAFKGRSVKLRFSFDSVDHVLNEGFGVVVDDIAIRKVCLLP